MIAHLIDHLSKEIQKITETTITFRTRIAFVAWIGPFILLSSVIVASKGIFRIPTNDPLFIRASILCCICYLALGYIGAKMEKMSWERCNFLRQKIIQYAKLKSPDNISDLDLRDRTPDYVLRVYMWAFIVIVVSFVSFSIMTSRIEGRDGSRANPKSVPVTIPDLSLIFPSTS